MTPHPATEGLDVRSSRFGEAVREVFAAPGEWGPARGYYGGDIDHSLTCGRPSVIPRGPVVRPKLERNALVRMRAAFLDLQSAQRYTEANDLLELIERIEPPVRNGGRGLGQQG